MSWPRSRSRLFEFGLLNSLITLSVILLSFLFIMRQNSLPQICIVNAKSGLLECRPRCSVGSFSLNGMSSCHPWLNCTDIANTLVILDHTIGEGAVKKVQVGNWSGHIVAVSFLQSMEFLDDFLHNLKMLQLFNPNSDPYSNKIVQLIGWCVEDMHVLVTEYHPLGSADDIHLILQNQFVEYYTLAVHFNFCVQFVEILHMLHTHVNGSRVMCDANTPQKALSQLLVSNNLTFILNDLDALPLVNSKEGALIKCGSKELFGDFVAPEQLWPYHDLPFNDSSMPGYDEKVDIWKVPDVCNELIRNFPGVNKLQLHLSNLHLKCKHPNPQMRPTAWEILEKYSNTQEKMNLHLVYK